MSSSGTPPYQLEDDFSDDDDLLELETLAMLERDWKQKMPQRTCRLSGQEYTTFLLNSNPHNIKDILRVDKHTFRALVVELVRRNLFQWDHKNLSVEESLAIFLYVCGQNARARVVADRFQRSLDTISRHFNIILVLFAISLPLLFDHQIFTKRRLKFSMMEDTIHGSK
ncbi:hypothetical protein RHMOL_Rhmol06G0244600 [Rhododendron molle]|uniref:Uncharacterized protein n=1 Tax=Rhododendron molle TaxID=49168 RepID=A0ACC0NFM4_RHOML|nr:hypothetical protein RHMOL_Rhmol06G0244600 [Rhododendron molle]